MELHANRSSSNGKNMQLNGGACAELLCLQGLRKHQEAIRSQDFMSQRMKDEMLPLSPSPASCVLLAPCPRGPAVSLIRQALGDCLRHFLVTNAVLEQETDWKGLRRSYK